MERGYGINRQEQNALACKEKFAMAAIGGGEASIARARMSVFVSAALLATA